MKRTGPAITFLALSGLLLLSFSLTAGHALGADHAASRQAQWDTLKHLARGKKILVEMSDGESFQGKFEGVSGEALMISSKTGERAISRQTIVRVSAKGQGHRWRNTLSLAAIFGAAGFALAKIRQHQEKDCPPGLPLGPPLCGKDSNTTVAVISLFEAGTGALMGAALSTIGWHEVYRAGLPSGDERNLGVR